MTVREEIRVPSRPVLSHAADAVRANGYVFVAGVLPVDASGGLVGHGEVGVQAERVFGDLGEILAASGCSFADVLTLSVYLTDVGDRPVVDPVVERMFGEARPASTMAEATAHAVPGARIEVDCGGAVP